MRVGFVAKETELPVVLEASEIGVLHDEESKQYLIYISREGYYNYICETERYDNSIKRTLELALEKGYASFPGEYQFEIQEDENDAE